MSGFKQGRDRVDNLPAGDRELLMRTITRAADCWTTLEILAVNDEQVKQLMQQAEQIVDKGIARREQS